MRARKERIQRDINELLQTHNAAVRYLAKFQRMHYKYKRQGCVKFKNATLNHSLEVSPQEPLGSPLNFKEREKNKDAKNLSPLNSRSAAKSVRGGNDP
jgi:hypothetical protein